MKKILLFLMLLCVSAGYAQTEDITKMSMEKKIALAERGNAEAQCELGRCYYLGLGVAQDYTEAAKWWKKAAEQGDAEAQNMLGVCYSNGQGVTQNYAEAVKWYRKAAEQGDAEAQYNLAECYEEGEGVEKNIKEAEKWYKKAEEQGAGFFVPIVSEDY